MAVRGFWCMTRRRLAREALFQNVEGDFSVIVQSGLRTFRTSERTFTPTNARDAGSTSLRATVVSPARFAACHSTSPSSVVSNRAMPPRGMSAEVRRSHVSRLLPRVPTFRGEGGTPLTLPLVPRSSNRTSARRSSRFSTRAASPGCSRTWRRRLRRRAWCSRP